MRLQIYRSHLTCIICRSPPGQHNRASFTRFYTGRKDPTIEPVRYWLSACGAARLGWCRVQGDSREGITPVGVSLGLCTGYAGLFCFMIGRLGFCLLATSVLVVHGERDRRLRGTAV